MNFDTTGVMTVLGILAAIAVTVLAYIFIIPEKKREKLPKIFQIIHDLFNFKELYLEKILKALYVLSTVACVTIGLFWQLGFSVWENWNEEISVEWAGGRGLLLILVGPIVIRIVYEALMMFVLLVKNTIDINNKLKAPYEEETSAVQETTEA